MKLPSWISAIKFLCFDLDGTLFRNVPESWAAIQEKIYDRVMVHRNYSRLEAEAYVKRRYEMLGSSTKVLNELGIDGGEFFIGAFSQLDLSRFVKHDTILKELLKKLSIRYRLGMVSNTHMSIAEKKLQAIGIPESTFDPLITTYEMGTYKPDPTPFLKALELVNVAPEESVYVGDSESNDILGAKAVGMHTIMVWGESGEADLSLSTIYDLEEIFLKRYKV